jgi:hypothetical protein
MLIYRDFNNVINKITAYNWYILQKKNADQPEPFSLFLSKSYFRQSQYPSHSSGDSEKATDFYVLCYQSFVLAVKDQFLCKNDNIFVSE